MTTQSPFMRVLDDAECGELMMDWQVARVCRRARGQVEQMVAVASVWTKHALFDSGATNTQRECDSLAPWGRHDGVRATQDSISCGRFGAGRPQPMVLSTTEMQDSKCLLPRDLPT